MKTVNIVYWPFVCLWFLISIFPILLTPLCGDESFFFYYSLFMKHGGTFFGTYWIDDKPGGMQFLYYLITPFKNGIFNLYSIRIFTIFYQAFTTAVFYVLSRRIFVSRPGIAKVTLPIFILLYLNPLVEGQYSNGDNFVVLWILLAAYFFTVSRHLFTALSIGICFCLKQNTALEVLPSSLTLIGQHLSDLALPLGMRLKRALAMSLKQIVVFFVPIGILILYTIYLHTSGHFFRLTFLDRIQSHILHKDYELATRFFVPIFRQTSVLWFGLLGYTGVFILRIFSGKSGVLTGTMSSSLRWYIFVWAIVASISVWVGGYFFPHYFIEITPILTLGAVLFLVETPAIIFYVLLIFSISIITNCGLPVRIGASVVAIITGCCETRLIRVKDIVRTCLVLLCLIMAFNTTPFSFLSKFIKSKDFQIAYSLNDKDIFAASTYLYQNNAKNTFVYDYTMEIYSLSGIIPEFKYPAKALYINYARLIKNNLCYPSDENILRTRREELISQIKQGKFKNIVINFNSILPGEDVYMKPIVESMVLYKPEKTFGNVWVYTLSDRSDISATFRERVRDVRVESKSDIIDIRIKRSAFIADTEMLLVCEDVQWHYPENGIIYPMRASQDHAEINVKANRRGMPARECSLVLKNLFREDRIPFRLSSN